MGLITGVMYGTVLSELKLYSSAVDIVTCC